MVSQGSDQSCLQRLPTVADHVTLASTHAATSEAGLGRPPENRRGFVKKVMVSPRLTSVFHAFLIICVILALLPPSAVTVLAREDSATFDAVRGNDPIPATLGDLEPQEVEPDGDLVPPGCPGTITVNGGDYVGSCRVNPNASVILEKGTGWLAGQFGLVFRVFATAAVPYEVYALSSSTWYPILSSDAPFSSDTGSGGERLAAVGSVILGRSIFTDDA